MVQPFMMKKPISLSIPVFGLVQSVIVPLSVAAETVGKDENCNNPQCLGVWGGLLANCPHDKMSMNVGAGCASSQDDTPGVFAEPWDYSESSDMDWELQMRRLIPAIQLTSTKRGDNVELLKQENRYVRVLFTDMKTSERSIGEFYFTPNDTTIQFRVGSILTQANKSSPITSIASVSSMKNLERCESIRKQLGYVKLPILRNRKRTFFFGESDFDRFGPGSALIDSPAEMRKDELEGLPEYDPNLKIDFVESFPLSGR